MNSSHPVALEAKPGALSLVPAETAVLVVDMQNDFGAPGGMFARAGVDIAPIRAIVDPITRVLRSARAAGARIVYLTMAFRADLSDLGAAESANAARHRLFGVGQAVATPAGGEGRILVRDTWNTAILEELTPEACDIVVAKQRFSGFYNTELDTILKSLSVKNLIFTGCTTSVCVESTLRDAFYRDYRCVLLEDCTAEPIAADAPRSNHDATLTLVQTMFGWVANACAFTEAFESRQAAA